MTAKKFGGVDRILCFLIGLYCMLGGLGAVWAWAWNDVQPQKLQYLGALMLVIAFALGCVAWQAFLCAFKR